MATQHGYVCAERTPCCPCPCRSRGPQPIPQYRTLTWSRRPIMRPQGGKPRATCNPTLFPPTPSLLSLSPSLPPSPSPSPQLPCGVYSTSGWNTARAMIMQLWGRSAWNLHGLYVHGLATARDTGETPCSGRSLAAGLRGRRNICL